MRMHFAFLLWCFDAGAENLSCCAVVVADELVRMWILVEVKVVNKCQVECFKGGSRITTINYVEISAIL